MHSNIETKDKIIVLVHTAVKILRGYAVSF